MSYSIDSFIIDNDIDLVTLELRGTSPLRFDTFEVSYYVVAGYYAGELLVVAGIVAVAVGLVVAYAILVVWTAIYQVGITFKGLP